MNLSNELISQFVKATKDTKKTSTETTVYGTTVEYNGKIYVKLDGSDLLTPVSKTTDVKNDERVTVMIKDHTATITGNISSPSARTHDVQEMGGRITEAEILIADKVSTKTLEAETARINSLVADNVVIREKLTASEAEINELIADNVTINGKLTAQDAEFVRLEAEKLSVTAADIKFATIESLDAIDANIHNLEATYGQFQELTTGHLEAIDATIKTIDTEKLVAIEASIESLESTKLSTESADIKYANIDFANIGEAAFRKLFSDTGLIKDLVVGDTTITGELVGVTLKGDLVEAGTLKADRLVVKGSDGLYYKLNFEAGTFAEGEVVPEDSLHGSVITAHSITAEKVSVKDLVAFDATIGGFNITESAIYSGVKESVDNTTTGTYLDRDGQVAFGDGTRFLKYYKDQNGQYRLEIAADNIIFGSNNKSIEDAVSDSVDEALSDMQIGARNLIRNSTDLLFENYYFSGPLTLTHDGEGNVTVTCGASAFAFGDGVALKTAATISDDGSGNIVAT